MRLLWDEFLRQTALDLGATRDALGAAPASSTAERVRVRRLRAGARRPKPGPRATRASGSVLRAERDAEPADLVGRLRLALAAR